MSSEQVRINASTASVRAGIPLRVNNVMKRLRVSDSDVRYLARHGKLRGFKVGKLWFFWESDVLEYQRRNSPRVN